jgi:hypothetical protein
MSGKVSADAKTQPKPVNDLSLIQADGKARIGQSPKGDALSIKEQDSFDHEAHAPNVKHDLVEHVLLSVLGVVLIGFALLTAAITHFASSQKPLPYFSENMQMVAVIAEWAILLGGVATTASLAVGLTLTSIINLVEKVILHWRNMKRVWQEK